MKFNQLFRYCPVCGSADFHQNNEKSMKCHSCNFSWYVNPSGAVAAFILNPSDELLVTIRAKDPVAGTCDLPGGFVDTEESAEEALIRELKEELAIDIVQVDYLFSLPNDYLYSGWTIPTLDLFYLVRIGTEIVPKAADDVAEYSFLPLHRVDPQQFGLHSIRKAVSRFVETYKK